VPPQHPFIACFEYFSLRYPFVLSCIGLQTILVQKEAALQCVQSTETLAAFWKQLKTHIASMILVSIL